MKTHRAILETGPGAIRRICCAADVFADAEVVAAALGAIDDRVALLGGRPVRVDALWQAALRSSLCPEAGGTLLLVHPSWWSSSRVGVVSAAARTLADDVMVRPRSWVLARACRAGPAVVVEIAERLVVVGGTEVVAIPRAVGRRRAAEEVATAVAATTGTVVVDAPGDVTGAAAFARALDGAARRGGRTVVHVDEAGVARLARRATPSPVDVTPLDVTPVAVTPVDVTQIEAPRPPAKGVRPRSRLRTGVTAAAIVLAAAAPAVTPGGQRAAAPARTADSTFLVEGSTFLVEDRVAVTVPADWPARRVVTGPGSARLQVTSPSDPEVALHITQSPVPGEALSGAAERLKRAIAAEPAAVFVDFDPSGTSAGRPAVTYREVRAHHHVRWTVLLDGAVRISVGCQSRPDGYDAVRDACERAVRSAHALG